MIKLENVDHAYGDLVVYRGLNFEAERGQRTVLVGPNGAGKSTLLKLLGGSLEVQSGTRELGHNVKVGYFSQYRVEMLKPSMTVLETARDMPNPVSEQIARTVLGSFLFRGDDVFKTTAVLSGGEKTRLALVKLLLDPPNLLLMDEPTTHLDVGSIDALIGALAQYEGHAHLHQPRRLFHSRGREDGPAHQRRPAHALRGRLRLLPREIACHFRARCPNEWWRIAQRAAG